MVGVFFDLDGTLVEAKASIMAAQCALGEMAIYASDDELIEQKRKGLTTREYLSYFYEQHYSKPPNQVTLDSLFNRKNEWQAGLSRWTLPFPQSAPLLTTLKSRGNYLAIVSNSYHSVISKVLRLHGLDLFDIVIGQDDVSNPKPDPEGYDLARKVLNLEKIYVVGDSDLDFDAVQHLRETADVKFIFVNSGLYIGPEVRKRLEENADFVVTSSRLMDIADYVK